MNAKEEFLKVTDKSILKCAVIDRYSSYYFDEGDEKPEDIVLPINFSEEEYNSFLEQLNFDYNNGYGSQNLFGIIWNNNGSWLNRGEYDGSEWWELHSYPEIPESCNK